MKYERELILAIVQQTVDDFIWACRMSSGCIDSRYEEFYFNENGMRRKVKKKKEIFISKVEMLKDVKSFLESDWGELVCQYSINRDSYSVYKALVKNFGIDDSIQRGLEEGVV